MAWKTCALDPSFYPKACKIRGILRRAHFGLGDSLNLQKIFKYFIFFVFIPQLISHPEQSSPNTSLTFAKVFHSIQA